MKFEIMTF